MQPRLEEMGEGSTNQKELKPLTLQKLRIPVPPDAEQKQIVKQVLSIFSQINDIEYSLS